MNRKYFTPEQQAVYDGFIAAQARGRHRTLIADGVGNAVLRLAYLRGWLGHTSEGFRFDSRSYAAYLAGRDEREQAFKETDYRDSGAPRGAYKPGRLSGIPAPRSDEHFSGLEALARRVANLNPDAGEIGEGMLRSLVDEARSLVGEDWMGF